MVRNIIRTTYIPDNINNKELCMDCTLSLDVPYEKMYNKYNGQMIHITKDDNKEFKGCNRGYRLKGYNLEQCEILMIGEAPGFNEVEKAIPFIGKSGELLKDLIRKSTSLSDNIFGWTNTVQCRPPGNATPKSKYINACVRHLINDIEQAKPKLIVLIGAIASKNFINNFIKKPGYKFKSILSHHGEYTPELKYKNVPVINMIHPAAYLHANNNQAQGITILSRIKKDIIYMEKIYNDKCKDVKFIEEKKSLW